MGEGMKDRLKEKFAKRHLREFKGVWTAITGSILDLLSEEFFQEQEKYKERWSLHEFLRVLVPFIINDLVELTIVNVLSLVALFPRT